MSWIQKLYETYNNCQSMVGYSEEESRRPLLPICHITAQAHIEIVIDQAGNFRDAHVIPKQDNNATTIIPCTESSGSKAGITPDSHPLCDKLQYVAGDFIKYGGCVTSGFADDPQEPYRIYIELLTKWCESDYAHPKAVSVLGYVKKGTVIKDLVDHHILYVGEDGKFISKKDAGRDKNTPDIFSVINSQGDAFIRWIVESPGVLETKLWRDKTLWKSWINYYQSTRKKEPLCFTTGEKEVLSNNHPKYIRVKGDNAKLISSNDTRGFTYLGRFQNSYQACNISLEVSHKAHNALSWLIDRQGKVFFIKGEGGKKEPGLTVLAWATSTPNIKIPQPTDDPGDILGIDNLPVDSPLVSDTAQEIGIKLSKKISGYNAVIGSLKSIQVIALNSASKGRLAITYYQEQDASDYFKKIDNWHEECAWIHNYRFQVIFNDSTNKWNRKYHIFVGAPAPIDIAEAAYGQKVDDKLKQSTIVRILPCIVEGRQIPRDLVESTVRKACNRIAMEHWEWNKTLTIACALYKKYNRKENYDMTLDPNRKTRDYLYGRLLALAESLEEWALNKANEKRDTNAARLMQRFAERPYSTWRTIELALTPYKARLGGKSKKRQRMIDDVIASFSDNDFTSDKRLSGEFLLGYHCQREYLRSLASASQEQDEEDE